MKELVEVIATSLVDHPAKSIRSVVKAAATKDDKKVVVEILQ
ncbi:MAG: hypothetical protein K0S18_1161 [Anaerocolumna sp.]|nr:hypothetical protein [Anaerocolumna sp.]